MKVRLQGLVRLKLNVEPCAALVRKYAVMLWPAVSWFTQRQNFYQSQCRWLRSADIVQIRISLRNRKNFPRRLFDPLLAPAIGCSSDTGERA